MYAFLNPPDSHQHHLRARPFSSSLQVRRHRQAHSQGMPDPF